MKKVRSWLNLDLDLSLPSGADWLPDGWEKRLQLHRQANVPADLESARHGDGCSTQLALQNLDAILSRHREHYVGIRMHPLCNLTGPFPDRENVLPALRAAQIELVDRIKIFGSICIELTWEKLKKLFDGGGVHGSCEGEGLLDRYREPRCRGSRSLASSGA